MAEIQPQQKEKESKKVLIDAQQSKLKKPTAKEQSVPVAKVSDSKIASKTVPKTESKTVHAEMKDALSSPQKARLVADLVRGMNALKALDVLSLTQKKAAVSLRKVIVAGIASAQHDYGMDKKELVISRILIDEGVKFPRYRIVSRGRGHRYVRRRSRLIVELTTKKSK